MLLYIYNINRFKISLRSAYRLEFLEPTSFGEGSPVSEYGVYAYIYVRNPGVFRKAPTCVSTGP